MFQNVCLSWEENRRDESDFYHFFNQVVPRGKCLTIDKIKKNNSYSVINDSHLHYFISGMDEIGRENINLTHVSMLYGLEDFPYKQKETYEE